MIFKNFVDQDWTWTEKFHSPLIFGLYSGLDCRYCLAMFNANWIGTFMNNKIQHRMRPLLHQTRL